MSSGHKSGLQTSKDFAQSEQKIRKRQREELAQYSANAGASGKTVYRDATGRKTAAPEIPDTNLIRQKQRLANKGAYQKQQEERQRQEMEEASSIPLARGLEDEQMEERKKAVIREGDPMAMYAWKQQQEELAKQQKGQKNNNHSKGAAFVPQKPVYKGPHPKANRYGIRPGYRWDGIDRGNGFEDRLLEALHSKGRKKEEAYKWSAADM